MEKAIKVRGRCLLPPRSALWHSSRLRLQETEGTWGEIPATPGVSIPPGLRGLRLAALGRRACRGWRAGSHLVEAGGVVCAHLEPKMSGLEILDVNGMEGVSLLCFRSLPKCRQQLLPDDPLAATALGDLDFTHPSDLFETSLLEICSFRRRWFAFLQTQSFGQ